MRYIIGVDTGGTFTDCVAISEEGEIFTAKHLTTYEDLSKGVLECIKSIATQLKLPLRELLANSIVCHGTTIATNTLLTRTGPKTGLITTKGFGDIPIMMAGMGRHAGLTEIEIKYQARIRKPEPIVPRELIKEVVERIDCHGNIVVPLDLKEAESAIDELVNNGVRSIAISTLFSPINPCHEDAIEELIRKRPEVIYCVTSHDVAPEIGEYKRTMTTIIEAYVGPITKTYITTLNEKLKELGMKSELLIIGAHGGTVPVKYVKAIETIESGPVGGTIGAAYIASLLGIENVIATDVGGTTFKVSLIIGKQWSYNPEPLIGRFHIAIPMLDIFSINAGGGTIVWVDPKTGLIKLGPRSAGACPGPVCYGLGGEEPTVTDANLILGFINPEFFLGGRIRLDKEKTIKVFKDKIADPTGMDIFEAAYAVYRIMNAQCADAIRVNTTLRGYKPEDFTLFVFGGAGPVHGIEYGAELGIKNIYLLNVSPVFGALGIALADVRRIYRKPFIKLMPVNAVMLTKHFHELEKQALAELTQLGFRSEDITLNRFIDMRYLRQAFAESVPVELEKLMSPDTSWLIDAFDKIYEDRYGKGTAYREAGVEVTSLKVEATVKTYKPIFKTFEKEKPDPSKALKAMRDVYWGNKYGFIRTKIYDGEKLRHGNVVEGPAIVEYPATTAVIHPDRVAYVDQYLNLVVKIE